MLTTFSSLLPAIPLKVKEYRPDLPEASEKPAKEDVKSKAEEKEEKLQLAKIQRLRNEELSGSAGKEAKTEEKKFEGVIGSKAPEEGEFVFPPLDLL